MTARYSVGIDLGTTNSAMAEVDLAVEPAGPGEPLPAPLLVEVPQIVAPGEVASRELLPSFVYLPPPHEAQKGAFALPWGDPGYVVGAYARDRGAQVPGRLVSSAKSWLSHPGVDKRGQLLPPGAEPEVPRISPVEASARILSALQKAWDASHDDEQLADQAVTLTVPASFDAVARELTVQAATQAGLGNVTLLEEPQAALYVGGVGGRLGASSSTLATSSSSSTSAAVRATSRSIAVGGEEAALSLERLAVGDHILLGGDNIDLALAHLVRTRLEGEGRKLDSWQLTALTHACRQAKEHPELQSKGKVSLAIPGRGSGLVGGTVRTELSVAELRSVVEGFFPDVPIDAAPAQQRRLGLTTLGLPYAQDPAVTRHLAAFLRRAGGATKKKGATFLHPTALLFNGGVFKDAGLQELVGKQVDRWVTAEKGAPLQRLVPFSLDLSVAHGAAYSGLARRGRGIRIRGGTARAYYVGIESAAPAVPGYAAPLRAACLAPFGMEEGSSVEIAGLEVGAVVGEKTSFRFFASSARRDDQPGTMVEDVSELQELPPIESELPAKEGSAGEVLPVGLRSSVTEVGTLALELFARDEKHAGSAWKLEFSVRGE